MPRLAGPEARPQASLPQYDIVKVAVVHDWLVAYGGGERALKHILRCFPGADLFVPVDFLAEQDRDILNGSRVHTSFIQRMPAARTRYWDYLPLMPIAMEQFDLTGFDVVISNSHSVAKGVIVHPEQVHASYVLSPMRYAWDLQASYLRDFGLTSGVRSIAARVMLHRLRKWDVSTSARVDAMAAPSRYIARRIELAYRRPASILPPPVDVDFFTPADDSREPFYLAASRLIPFKRMDAIVDAFAAMPTRSLVVIGDGPDLVRLRRRASRNVRLLGFQPDEMLRSYMRRARAFVFAAPEDFGIVMVEAQACGTPVIALGRGGALDIVRGLETSEPTGVFFSEPTPAGVRAGIEAFEQEGNRIAAEHCRQNALRFSATLFEERFRAFIAETMEHFRPDRR